MFSDNSRISPGQMQALLLTDWMGKILLLIPVLLQGRSGLEALAGCGLGLLVAFLFLGLSSIAAGRIRTDCYEYVRKKAGREAAFILYLVYLIYLFINTSLLLYLCQQIGTTYLLPEVHPAVLLLLAALCGYYLASGGLEVRGRVSELTACVIGGILLLVLVIALFQIQPSNLLAYDNNMATANAYSINAYDGNVYSTSAHTTNAGDGNVYSTSAYSINTLSANIFSGAWFTVASFCGTAVLPLMILGVNRKKKWKRSGCLALGLVGLLLLLTCLCSWGVFGQQGMERLQWPLIALMSCTELPAVFLQRWDVLLVGVLLASLFLAVGGGVYYMKKTGRALLGAAGEGMWGWFLLAGACLLALRMSFLEDGLDWYGKLLLFFCAPGLILSVLFLLLLMGRRKSYKAKLPVSDRPGSFGKLPSQKNGKVRPIIRGRHQRNKKRKKRVGAVVLTGAMCLLLSGCTARELESRCFPLALEIGADDTGRVILTCAWPYADGSPQGAESSSDDMPKNTSEGASDDIPEDTSEGASDDIPEDTSEGASDDIPEDASDDMPEDTLEMDLYETNDSFTRAAGNTVWEAAAGIQTLQDKYVDYSHVKAILWDQSIAEYPGLEKQILAWLEKEPAFARNLLIFRETGLTLEQVQTRAQGQPGVYLENLYKNNEGYQEKVKTLKELLYKSWQSTGEAVTETALVK